MVGALAVVMLTISMPFILGSFYRLWNEADDTLCHRPAWVKFVLPDFNSAGFGLVFGAVGVGDHDLAAAVGGGRELLDQSLVLSGYGIDVKVAEYRCAVDGHVEDTAPRRGEIGLGEVQQNGVLAAGHHAWNRASEGSGPLRLINSHRRGIGYACHDDGVSGCVRASAGDVF